MRRMQAKSPVMEPPTGGTFAAYLEWMRARGLSPATLRAYTADLRQLGRWLAAAGIAPEDADTRTLRRYAAHLGTLRYAPATASRKLSAVRGLYAWLGEDLTPETAAAMQTWWDGSQDDRSAGGGHRYTPEEFGLDADELRERFAYYSERYPFIK